jgi:hypothetical protein
MTFYEGALGRGKSTREPVTKNCASCGAQFETRFRSQPFCFDCRKTQRARVQPGIPVGLRVLRTCEVCGGKFEFLQSRLRVSPARFCSHPCRNKAMSNGMVRVRKLDPRACERCGAQFQPYNRRHRFCSEQCSKPYWET